jgi:peptide-O-fucosyltransferase
MEREKDSSSDQNDDQNHTTKHSSFHIISDSHSSFTTRCRFHHLFAILLPLLLFLLLLLYFSTHLHRLFSISTLQFNDHHDHRTCTKLDIIERRRTVEWNPNPNKYLFAICLSGQMSNHLICLEKHMFFAALLNRILVIPSSKFDYKYNRVLDFDHINDCLRRKVIVSFEYFSKKNHLMKIDKFLCYFSLPRVCYLDEEHVKKLKSLGISLGGKPEPVWVEEEDIKKPNKRSVEDVMSKFASSEDVIAIGDVFYADLGRDWVMQPGGPIAHQCKTLIEPSRVIRLTAQRFVQTFLGNNFVALHFRRHGFLKFWYVLA